LKLKLLLLNELISQVYEIRIRKYFWEAKCGQKHAVKFFDGREAGDRFSKSADYAS
jgi:hypothetical protein